MRGRRKSKTEWRTFSFHVTGIPALLFIGLALAIPCLVGTRGDVTGDEELREAVQLALSSELSPQTLPVLKAAVDRNDEEAVVAINQTMEDQKPVIVAMRASSPFLSFISKSKTVVYVRYTRKGRRDSEAEDGYFRVSGSRLTGWGYAQRTSSLSYYLNVL